MNYKYRVCRNGLNQFKVQYGNSFTKDLPLIWYDLVDVNMIHTRIFNSALDAKKHIDDLIEKDLEREKETTWEVVENIN